MPISSTQLCPPVDKKHQQIKVHGLFPAGDAIQEVTQEPRTKSIVREKVPKSVGHVSLCLVYVNSVVGEPFVNKIQSPQNAVGHKTAVTSSVDLLRVIYTPVLKSAVPGKSKQSADNKKTAIKNSYEHDINPFKMKGGARE